LSIFMVGPRWQWGLVVAVIFDITV
jgi:hypothetical protein